MLEFAEAYGATRYRQLSCAGRTSTEVACVNCVAVQNAQNRLGYLVHLARALAGAPPQLTHWENELEEARLASEGTLCRDSMREPERKWLRANRSAAAAHWNLLTGITTEQLPYANN